MSVVKVRVLVDKNKRNFSDIGFISLTSVKEMRSISQEIEVLVLGELNESDKDVVRLLEKDLNARSSFPSIFMYINSNPSNTIKVWVLGNGGNVIEDSFFLSSSSELSNLLKSKDEVVNALTLTGNSVFDSFSKLLKENKTPNIHFLKTVDNALRRVSDEYENKKLEIQEISQGAVELYSDISGYLDMSDDELRKAKELLSESIDRIKELSNEGTSQDISQVGSNIFYFPRISVRVDSSKAILHIKEIGRTAYLTHLMVALRDFITNIKYQRARLVFIEPNLQVNKDIYDGIPNCVSVNFDNYADEYLYEDSEVLVISYPSIDVFRDILSAKGFTYYIIVDRAGMSMDYIIQNANKKSIVYASNSKQVLSRMGIQPQNMLISNYEGKDKVMSIKKLPNFSSDLLFATKMSVYTTHLKDLMNKLFNKADI